MAELLKGTQLNSMKEKVLLMKFSVKDKAFEDFISPKTLFYSSNNFCCIMEDGKIIDSFEPNEIIYALKYEDWENCPAFIWRQEDLLKFIEINK